MSLSIVLYLLTAVLLGGTAFAWYEFFLVTKDITRACQAGKKNVSTPFDSKCFYGALFFTAALILAVYALSFVR